MTLRDVMKYMESEYNIINNTPCEVCGDTYVTENFDIALIEDMTYDICECVCPNCGHEKIFEFHAPFIDEDDLKNLKKKLN
ncbi:MAG: metal-binding protein [Bacillota bacterium]|nr:metal-binding protein [Bacillota bacterium]